MSTPYNLRYTQTFYDDVAATTDYITYELKNKSAALDLLRDIETAISERLPFAESFEPYHPRRKLAQPYYRIYVKNFVVYYVVLHESGSHTMEVRRLLYKGRNRQLYI